MRPVPFFLRISSLVNFVDQIKTQGELARWGVGAINEAPSEARFRANVGTIMGVKMD
jgi:hypothetical protein